MHTHAYALAPERTRTRTRALTKTRAHTHAHARTHARTHARSREHEHTRRHRRTHSHIAGAHIHKRFPPVQHFLCLKAVLAAGAGLCAKEVGFDSDALAKCAAAVQGDKKGSTRTVCTVPSGVPCRAGFPCRAGYRAVRGTMPCGVPMPCGIPCRPGYWVAPRLVLLRQLS